MAGLTPSTLLILLFVAAAGAGLAIQGPINAVMARAAGGLAVAACISFFFGFLVLLGYTLARGAWPPMSSLTAAPWYVWITGLFGVMYLMSITAGVAQVGVLTTLTAAILGQVVAAVVLDRLGAFGLPVIDITWPRILGIAMVACGLVLTRA
jgi:bacterial/archaeal transporter family-2 protein